MKCNEVEAIIRTSSMTLVKEKIIELLPMAKREIIMFDDKILLITGGTGSFGNAVMKRFLDSNIKEIRIFSRDEKKQDDIRKKYNN